MPKNTDRNARQLVDRIQRALVAGRRDVADVLAYDAMHGNRPHTDDQLTKDLGPTEVEDITVRIWAIAGELFKGQPAKWRTLVGKLVKVCHKQRAYEVLVDCEKTGTQDPRPYIAAAIARGMPSWKMTETELLADCDFYGIPTANRTRKDLEREIDSFHRRSDDADEKAGFFRPTVCRFPEGAE